MAGVAELHTRWGGRTLVFRLQRDQRRRLRIVVQPDGSIDVFAPEQAGDDEVLQRVQRRGDWIVRQLDRFAQWHPRTPARQYVSGETHLFLGRQLRLRIVDSGAVEGDAVGDLAAPFVSGDRLVVTVPRAATREDVRARVDGWYVQQAARILRDQYHQQSPLWARHCGLPPRLIVRSLRNRWGSLTAAGSLVLNRDLVRASPRLIDYVIAHEMAHAVHADHGRQWQRLLSRVMPDWRERKSALEQQLL